MRTSLRMLLAGAALYGLSGCASLSLPFTGEKTEIVRATQANPVMEAITIWEPGEGRGLDNLPTRGFAGQVLFFTYKDPSPAMVEGNVTVYVFDDQGTEQEQSRPLWQHTFTAQQWNALGIQTNLGTAYQLFVPYTRKGQHTAHCSLRIKFEPDDGGPPVYSKMANVTLEGKGAETRQSKLTRRRIEPERLDTDRAADAQSLAEDQPDHTLRSSTVTLPGRAKLTAQQAARLQQFAQKMVQQQQQTGEVEQTGEIQQAGYFEEAEPESPSDDVYDNPADPRPAESIRRYHLYR